MVNRPPVPVTIVGGAGADDLARTLSAPDDSIVAGSWHGPGSVRIEADTAHRTPGCACCTLRLDVIDGLLRAVRRPKPPAHVLVVAAPGDDVTTIAYTVLSDADLARHVRLDGVVVSLDAVAMATRAAGGMPLGSGPELEALVMADALVLDRASELTNDAIISIRQSLGAINAIGSTLERTADGSILGAQRHRLIGLDAWHGAPAVGSRNGVQLHRHGNGPSTLVLRQQAPLDPDAVDAWLDRVIESHAQRLVRLQGALAIDSAPARVCCHGVRSYAMSHSESADPPASRRGESLVVIVGHDLDAEDLSSEFAATRVR
ncbi:MAG: GTP-binding protein [Actinomycetota bacterium]